MSDANKRPARYGPANPANVTSGSLRSVSAKLRDATPDDVALIARLHTESWRTAYDAILSPDFLADGIEADRLRTWSERFAAPNPAQRVTVGLLGEQSMGFVCTFLDEDPQWGALVDNLHVVPAAKGKGLGARLLRSAAAWVSQTRPGQGLHLWVYEANAPAAAFYDRMGGEAVERALHDNPGGGGAPAIRYAWPDPRRMRS